MGRIDPGQLATYGADGSLFEAIGTERTPIVDLTCGKLGQGLSGAMGFAIAARLAGEDRGTFASLSDGEMEEGQVSEAAMFASHHAGRMGPLTVVIEALCQARHNASNAEPSVMRSPPPPASGFRGRRV